MNHDDQIKIIKKQIKAKGFTDEDDWKAIRYHQLCNQKEAKLKIKLIFVDLVHNIILKFLKKLLKLKR